MYPTPGPTIGTKIGPMRCSDFCSDPMIRRIYPDTSAHMLFWELNALLSGRSLNREALREVKILFCKQGVTGSIPVTSTNFFLIAKDLEKSPRPERSVIRAHCARTVHECVIGEPLRIVAPSKKHRPPPRCHFVGSTVELPVQVLAAELLDRSVLSAAEAEEIFKRAMTKR